MLTRCQNLRVLRIRYIDVAGFIAPVAAVPEPSVTIQQPSLVTKESGRLDVTENPLAGLLFGPTQNGREAAPVDDISARQFGLGHVQKCCHNV